MQGEVVKVISNQFYVKAKPGQDCSGRFSFGVYPCDYFGECNDSVDPIEVYLSFIYE